MKNHATLEQTFFLSHLIGSRVLCKDKKIGKLEDLVIQETEKIPEVTDMVIARPFGQSSLLVPWEKVKEVAKKRIMLEIDSVEPYQKAPEGKILLRDHILDKKVLDLDDNEVEMVYDVKLVLLGNKLYASDVDTSKYGLLRRVGLKPLAKFIYKMADKIRKDTISWTYIQPLPEHIGSFQGNVKLKVLREKLTEIHPVDLADILEELNHDQRLALFGELNTEHASDTLEETEPRVQRDLIASIKKERAAELINAMTPAQAADILAILPASEADSIMTLINKENARKTQFLLDKQEETITNFATSQFIKLSPATPVSEVLENYRYIARDKDEIMYLYVVNGQNRLLGVADIKELLRADPAKKMEEIMVTQVISLKPGNTLLDAAEMFSRYSFRSIPVTDDNDRILGVLPYRDITHLKHRFV